MLDGVELTLTEVERLAARILAVEPQIDLGPAGAGGRYYGELLAGLGELIDAEELQTVALLAVEQYFLARRAELRSGLARWLRAQRAEISRSCQTTGWRRA